MDIRELKDRHEGREAVIVCTGPSLKETPPERLDPKFVTISMNGIFRYDGWKPDYWVLEDVLFADANRKHILDWTADHPDIGRVIAQDCRLAGRMDQYARLRRIGGTEPPFGFTRDLSMGSYCFGGTATYLALQLAFHMGIRVVRFIGLDFRYRAPDPTNLHAAQATFQHKEDTDHFTPDYTAPGQRTHQPRLDRHIHAYEKAQDVFLETGGRIWNHTPGSALDVFPPSEWEYLVRS